jgi:GT2 family glycosyltransferase
VSAVIPVRNGEAELPFQLEALAGQDLDGPWEVIVADNGSTDGTTAVAESFRDRIPGLRVVDASDRAGQAHAANVGAGAARHRSLLFLDADDVVAPGYLAAMSEALDDSPFVAARLDCESLNPPWLRASRPATQTESVGAPFGYLPSAAGCSLGVWRSAFAAVGGFDPEIRLGNDVDLCWRVQRAVGPLRFVPDAVVRYRYRDTLRGIFAQARTYGTAGPTLYRRYREEGMPRRPWRTAVRFHAAAVVRLLRARSRADLAACAFLLGFRVGLVEGCITNRTLYL